MGWLGRFQVGQVVTLSVQCQDGEDTPVVPDNPPAVQIRDGSGVVARLTMPVLDRYVRTGLFSLPVRLSGSYAAGRFVVTYFYHTSGGYFGLEIDYFEVLPGGDAEGAVLTQYYLERPEAQYLVQQTEAGSTLLRRGPSI